MVPLKYLSKSWRTLEMPLINCEIFLPWKWSKNCILVAGTAPNQNGNQNPVVTLSTHDNIKLLKQLESGFEKAVNWNIYLPKTINQT